MTTIPGAGAFRSAVIERHRKHVNKGMARLADLMGTHVEVRSAGNYVFDERDERYLDCGGYGVFTLGHRHPAVVEAVIEQLGRLPLSTRSLVSPAVAAAAEALRVDASSLIVLPALPEEVALHEQYLDAMEKDARGPSLWRRLLAG